MKESELTVRATLTLRNEKMIEARKRLGISQTVLAKRTKTSLGAVMALERFDFASYPKRLEAYALAISAYLGLDTEDVYPLSAKGQRMTSTRVSVVKVRTDRLLDITPKRTMLVESTAEKSAEESERNDLLRAAIKKLPFRTRKVLKMRFGIDGHQHTLEEVARHFKTTPENVRQIELKAIRSLRTRRNARTLHDLMKKDEEQENE